MENPTENMERLHLPEAQTMDEVQEGINKVLMESVDNGTSKEDIARLERAKSDFEGTIARFDAVEKRQSERDLQNEAADERHSADNAYHTFFLSVVACLRRVNRAVAGCGQDSFIPQKALEENVNGEEKAKELLIASSMRRTEEVMQEVIMNEVGGNRDKVTEAIG